MLTIACISDTHLYHRRIEIPECDVLVHAGDALSAGTEINYLLDMDAWAGELLDSGRVKKECIFSPGNHELCLDKQQMKNIQATYFDPDTLMHWTTLIGKSIVVEGVKFYGHPWTPEFYSWAFNVRREHLDVHVNNIPEDTDVLISHGPPYTWGDLTTEGDNVGCQYLANFIVKFQPRLVVCGHIHYGYGMYTCNNTQIINASICTETYNPKNKPFLIEV